MVISEVTMARLNNCNVLSHFSHSGVDEVRESWMLDLRFGLTLLIDGRQHLPLWCQLLLRRQWSL
jgi:hypothetical protein